MKACQGGYKPGKPGIFREFSESGKLRKFCTTAGKNCNKENTATRCDFSGAKWCKSTFAAYTGAYSTSLDYHYCNCLLLW